MKRRIFAALALALCISLLACSKQSYANDVRCESLCLEALGALASQTEYAPLGKSHREFYFGSDEQYDDCYIAYSEDTNDINELGVFHAANGDSAARLFELCEDYVRDLSENSRAFIGSYAPAELPKLDAAAVRRFGNYVVYAVMSKEDVASVMRTVEVCLK